MAIGDSGIGGSGLSFEVGIGSGGISKVWETIPVLTPGTVSVSGTEITLTGTTSGDISAGVFGFRFGIYDYGDADPGYVWSENVAGQPENQSITYDIALRGGTVNSIVNAQIYYNLDPLDPIETRVYGSAIVPVVELPAISGTATEGETLTALNGIIVGGYPMTVTPSVWGCTNDSDTGTCTQVDTGDTTYVLQAGDIGDYMRSRYLASNAAGSDFTFSNATAQVSAGYDPQAQAVIDQWKVTTPALNATWQAAIDDLVVAAKANGYWTSADNFYVFAADVETNALIDWKNPTGTASTNVSSTAFAAKEGFTGDGSADYIDHNISANAGTNFVRDSNGRAFYLRSNPATGNQRTYGGFDTDATSRYGDLLAFSPRINGGNLTGGSGNGSTGVRGFSRTNSNDVAIYHSGLGSPITTASTASAALPAKDHLTLAGNNTQYGTAQISFSWIGGPLTQDIVDDMATDVAAFLAAVAGA